MTRRKDNSLVQALYKLFMEVPSWVCVPVALAAFVGVQVTAVVLASNKIVAMLAPSAPMIGGIFSMLILLAGFKAAIEKWRKRRLVAKQTGAASIRELSWSAFELLVGEAYRQQGYEVTETGGGGPDGGIDLKLRKNSTTTLVQCKQWKAWKVGVKPVRELYGVLMAERADEAIFATSGVFTKEAREFAQGKPIELLDGEALAELIQSVQRTRTMAAPSILGELQARLESSPATQSCPRCGSGMHLRTARKGANAGDQFWGCSKFPKCRGTVPLLTSDPQATGSVV